MDGRTRGKVIGLVGLGYRGRLVVVGVEQVRGAAHKRELALALVAHDAAHHSREKVLPLLRAKGVRFVEAFSAAELGDALGRAPTAAVGVLDRQLANGIREAMRAGSDGAP